MEPYYQVYYIFWQYYLKLLMSMFRLRFIYYYSEHFVLAESILSTQMSFPSILVSKQQLFMLSNGSCVRHKSTNNLSRRLYSESKLYFIDNLNLCYACVLLICVPCFM